MATLTVEQQIEAGRLYREGLSAQQIADHFNVSLNATFYSLRHQGIQRRSRKEANRIRYENATLSFQIKEHLSPLEEQLKLAGVMLYWAEGYKIGSSIDFANSDPEMALLFCEFLNKICGVNQNRLRASLYCYEGQDIGALHSYWSNLLNIPLEQFTKPYIKQAAVTARGPRMPYGLVHVRYCDKKLLQLILKWIGEYSQKCVGGGVVNRTRL